ncbi:MAG: hypothetical protein IKC87_07310 [Clostridia bacterium]|nr:hypothetical protein [Clostridia bacterium]
MKRNFNRFWAIAVVILVLVASVIGTSLTVGAQEATPDIVDIEIDNGNKVTLKDTDSDGYYEIGTADELYAFAALVIGGQKSISAELTANITVNENVLKADGSLNGTPARSWSTISTLVDPYKGSFDGGFHTISGIYCVDDYYVSLFGKLSGSASVKNLGIVDSYFKGKGRTATFAHESDGLIENCFGIATLDCVEDDSVANYYAGIAGYVAGSIRGCFFSGLIQGSPGQKGGIAGMSDPQASFESCYFDSTKYNGVAIGLARGSITNVEGKAAESFASGEVAYLLGAPYGQKLGTLDAELYPVFSDERVYKSIAGGNSTDGFEFVLSNTEHVVALEIFAEEAKGFDNIFNAISFVSSVSNGKITLLKDIIIEEYIDVEDYNLEIDLNGYEIRSQVKEIIKNVGGTVKIIGDNTEGSRLVTEAEMYYVIYNYGTMEITDVTLVGDCGILNANDSSYIADLTLNNVTVESPVMCLSNFGIAELNDCTFKSTDPASIAIANKSSLVIDGGSYRGAMALLSEAGDIIIRSGDIVGTIHNAINLVGGIARIYGGRFEAAAEKEDKLTTVFVNSNALLTIYGGEFSNGLYNSMGDINSLIASGYKLFDSEFNEIALEPETDTVPGLVRIYPDKVALAVNGDDFSCVAAFDTVSMALEYSALYSCKTLVLKDNDESFTVPNGATLLGASAVFSGEITNTGTIKSGTFNGKIKNMGDIVGGTFNAEINNNEDGRISSGCFNSTVTIKPGSKFHNNGGITIGENFVLEYKGGNLICNSHIGPATCVSAGVCRICEAEHEPIDPDAHVEGEPATCIRKTVCDLCGNEYGEYAPHNFYGDGTCATEGCDVVAVVMIEQTFYTSFSDALASVQPDQTIYVIRNFEISEDLTIPEHVQLNGSEFTITLNDCRLTLGGIINSGKFILNDSELVVDPTGIIWGGTYEGNAIINSGYIWAGSFYVDSIENDIDSSIENDGNLWISESTELTVDGYLNCEFHFGGVVSCINYRFCKLCAYPYEPKVDHKDENRDHNCDIGCTIPQGDHVDTNLDHNCDYGCEVLIGEHIDNSRDHVCDHGCDVAIGEHKDVDLDHKCDYGCIDEIGEHKDDDYDHKCDYGCTEAIGDHKDADNDDDHLCDYCDGVITTCDFGDPTCTVPATCPVCQKTDGEPLGHSYTNACDAICDRCYDERVPQEHYSKDADGICDECGESFTLSGGAIAGIVIGSTAVAGVGGFSLFWFVIKKKKWSDLLALFKR